MTLAEFMAKKAKSKVRKAKRRIKRRELGMAPAKTDIKTAIDDLCSWIVRRRDAKRFGGFCLCCIAARGLGFQVKPPREIELGYHIQPRGNMKTRWDLRNIIGACSPCNWREKNSRNTESGKMMLRAIHAAIIGEDVLKELEALSKEKADFSTADLLELRDKLRSEAEGRA